LALEDERKDREDATEDVDGHEEEQGVKDARGLVDHVELGSVERYENPNMFW